MPLLPFPPDSTPTEQELTPFFALAVTKLDPAYAGSDIMPWLARFLWKMERKEQDQNLFQVACPPHGLDYPAYLEALEWQEIRGKALGAIDIRDSQAV